MALLDSFRKKWRHSDPEVRAEAVRRLDPAEVEVLARVVQEDEELSVRRLAIKRLKDPDVLSQLAGSVDDAGLKRLVAGFVPWCQIEVPRISYPVVSEVGHERNARCLAELKPH